MAATLAKVARLESEAADLRLALRVARIGMWRREVATNRLEWSQELHALFGTDPGLYRPSVEGSMLLTHPEDRAMVRSCQARAITGEDVDYEFRVPQPDGSVLWRQTELRVERDSAGVPTVLRGVVQDITERKRASEHIDHLAQHDVLTGSANRAKLATSLRQHLERVKQMNATMAIIAIDLDGFKAVNDLLGHAVGDKLLQVVALRLRAHVREDDTVARLGGDEFVIIQGEAAPQPEGARCLAERLVQVLALPVDVPGGSAAVKASIGIALYPDDVAGMTDLREVGMALLAAADTAMYRVKRGGRNGHAFFRAGRDRQQEERRALEPDSAAAVNPQAAAG